MLRNAQLARRPVLFHANNESVWRGPMLIRVVSSNAPKTKGTCRELLSLGLGRRTVDKPRRRRLPQELHPSFRRLASFLFRVEHSREYATTTSNGGSSASTNNNLLGPSIEITATSPSELRPLSFHYRPTRIHDSEVLIARISCL